MDEIEIVTLEDILRKIPDDRMDAFLADLKAWALDGKKFMANCEAINPNGYYSLVWRDDGKLGINRVLVDVPAPPAEGGATS